MIRKSRLGRARASGLEPGTPEALSGWTPSRVVTVPGLMARNLVSAGPDSDLGCQ